MSTFYEMQPHPRVKRRKWKTVIDLHPNAEARTLDRINSQRCFNIPVIGTHNIHVIANVISIMGEKLSVIMTKDEFEFTHLLLMTGPEFDFIHLTLRIWTPTGQVEVMSQRLVPLRSMLTFSTQGPQAEVSQWKTIHG